MMDRIAVEGGKKGGGTQKSHRRRESLLEARSGEDGPAQEKKIVGNGPKSRGAREESPET